MVLFFCFSCNSQKKQVNENVIIISQKSQYLKGIQLVLKSNITDSRCPENTNCIWAGKVEIVIEVLENNILIRQEKLEIMPKNDKQNLKFLSQFYPNKTISSIIVKPFPKEGVTINPNDYYLELKF